MKIKILAGTLADLVWCQQFGEGAGGYSYDYGYSTLGWGVGKRAHDDCNYGLTVNED